MLQGNLTFPKNYYFYCLLSKFFFQIYKFLFAVDPGDIVTIGIANQRETTLVWDRDSGEPLHPAIAWPDSRAQTTEQARGLFSVLCRCVVKFQLPFQSILSRLPRTPGSKYRLQHLCGLPISSYFPALRLRWLLDHRPRVAEAARRQRLCFGTVDSWLLFNLVGSGGEAHVTDVTNASRTMLMNIETLRWDRELCSFFRIPQHVLPEIKSSSEVYGRLNCTALAGTPVSGCLGDQQVI